MSERQVRYPYFGIPPARQPRPAGEETALRGKRVILSTPEGFVYDMRAVSQVYESDDGPVLDVVTEQDYYAWMLTNRLPERQAFPAHLVWVE